ncbi:MAG: MBL fold metallo-hydrolase [Patescibacteria group bacterium]|nr:MBL fold metallo-hydrolase [Patescibacteria group bacterium]
MNKINILAEGYAKIFPDGWMANPNVVLVTSSNGIKIIVDPGCNRQLLLQKLSQANINPEEIDFVFLTHNHMDHSMNTALFPKAKVIDHEAIYDGDKAELVKDTIPGTDVKILQTPGHQLDHSSLTISTEEGIVVIAGDVFWFEDNEEPSLDVEKKDPYAADFKALKESRKKLIALADWIIPGHGAKIKNTR